MENQRRRDTAPEMALRRAVWRLGLRYRVDIAPIRGSRRRADLVFRSARVAVFVHGCFWHGCRYHGSLPKANRAWWRAKLEANRRRDSATKQALRKEGWAVVVIWEHEDPDVAALRITRLVRERRRH